MPDQTVYNTAETARRFTENAAEVARFSAGQGAKINRQVMDAWAASTDATLQATFELQNAAIAAGRTVLEATGNGNLALFQQWADVVRQAQQATLDAWQASKEATEKMGTMPGSN